MFMMPVHPPDRTFWSTLEEDTEKSLLADALGFDELWLGEHFSATTEPIPSPMMFFANLVARTKSITFGTAVINVPNHHPAIVAAEAAQARSRRREDGRRDREAHGQKRQDGVDRHRVLDLDESDAPDGRHGDQGEERTHRAIVHNPPEHGLRLVADGSIGRRLRPSAP